jgi:hypothetical protein
MSDPYHPPGTTQRDCDGSPDPLENATFDELWQACAPARQEKIAQDFAPRYVDELRDALLELEQLAQPKAPSPPRSSPSPNSPSPQFPSPGLPIVSAGWGEGLPPNTTNAPSAPPISKVTARTQSLGQSMLKHWLAHRDRALSDLHRRGMLTP